MPRVPKRNPARRAIHLVDFPDQMFMHRRNGGLLRSNLDPEVWDLPYTPVQGPELPRKLEQRRQYLRDAQDAYEADLAEERARQAYNRKVAAWNSYTELPYRQRQWIANKDAVRDYLDGMYGYDRKELDRINTLDELEDYLQTRHPEDDWPIPYDMQDSEVFGSFEEFPDDLSDAPWRMW